MVASALAMPESMIPKYTEANVIYVHAQKDQLCRINDTEELQELPDHIKVITITPGDEATTQHVLGGRSHNYEFLVFQTEFLLRCANRLTIDVNSLQEVAYTMLPKDYYISVLVTGLAILNNKDFEALVKKLTETTRVLRGELQNPTQESSYHILEHVSDEIRKHYQSKVAIGKQCWTQQSRGCGSRGPYVLGQECASTDP